MLDWKALAPHRPLEEGDGRYVARPDGGGERLGQLVKAGVSPIAVTGPAGCGKSTELARATAMLGDGAHLVHLDRALDLRHANEYAVFWAILGALGGQGGPVRGMRHPLDALRNHLRARRNEAEQILLIDGLEKAPMEVARKIAPALLDVAEESRLVVVLSPALVIGASAYDIINSTKLFPLRAMPYWGQAERSLDSAIRRVENVLLSSTGEESPFLSNILMRRLDLAELPPALSDLARIAAVSSGGLPRVFLQILQDAATYATLAGCQLPDESNLRSAMADQTDSLSLLLQDGDAEALGQAFGTQGLEVPLERKLRFLAHGLLLEYDLDDDKVVFPAPLLFKHFVQYLTT